MTKFLFRPYVLAFLVCILMILLGTFQSDTGSIDIQLHDTYIVVARRHGYYILAFLFFLFALFYLILDSWLTKGKGRKFQYAHFTVTIMSLGVFLYLFHSQGRGIYKGYLFWEAIDLLIFLVAQSVLLLYYIFCFFRRYMELVPKS
jgi:heme/copper-type cytochrome/quinol oxidase subunit 1